LPDIAKGTCYLGDESGQISRNIPSKMAQFGMPFLIYNSTLTESRKENFK
jgi:hypothetical protein